MHWTPHAPDTLICADNLPPSYPGILHPTIPQQKLHFLSDLLFAQILDADGFTPPVYVRGFEDGMAIWERRDAEFDRRVGVGYGWEGVRPQEREEACGGDPVVGIC